MNSNYAKVIEEDLYQLLGVSFITLVKEASWLAPIVVILKKNSQLRICMDYHWLNQAIWKDPFLFPFMDDVLDEVVGHLLYLFLDGRIRYNLIGVWIFF